MKKLVSIMLCVLMLGSTVFVAGCTDKSADKDDVAVESSEDEAVESTEAVPDYGNTKGAQIYYEFVDRIKENSDIEAVAKELCDESISGYSCDYMTVEEGYLNGFSDEIKGFNKGVMFGPVIGSIPFVAYIFETDDVNGLQSTLHKNADPRWNICTEADEVFSGTYENYVFFIMLPNE